MVQLSKSRGARVTAVCGTAHQELARSLGAGRVIDYAAQDFMQDDHEYDVVFDAGGRLQYPSGPSLTTISPVASSRSYAVASRLTLAPPTLNSVSFMPSGSQIRSRSASPKDMPVARATSTTVTLAAIS